MAYRNKRFEKRSRKRNRRTSNRSSANIFTRPSRASRAKSGIIYGLIVLAALFVFLFIFFNIMGGGNKVKLVDDLTAEIYSPRTAASFVEEVHNGKVTKDQSIDTSTLGAKTCKIVVTLDNGKEKEFEFQVTVVDTQAPIIDAEDSIIIFQGSNVDFLKQGRISDNSKEDPDLEVIGKWDISTVGVYPIKIVARDASGNKTEKTINLEVIDGNSKKGDYSFTTANGHRAEVINGLTYIDGTLIVNQIFSLPKTYAPGLSNEAYYAFYEMVDGAREDGIYIWGVSDYISWEEQEEIYKFYQEKDPENYKSYTKPAGCSEHQAGLAIDINSYEEGFGETEEGQWLANHCWEYGFIYRYPVGKESITGYNPEPWHFRYVGKTLAKVLYNDGDWLAMEEYFGVENKRGE